MAGRAATLCVRVERLWFRGLNVDGGHAEAFKRWFGKDPEVDQMIKDEFFADVGPAAAGEYAELEEHADGTLALIILFDQFTRNMFRGSAETYAYDGHALRLARHALDRGFDKKVDFFHRMFLYLPFEHAEDPEMQALCVRKTTELRDEVSEELRPTADRLLQFAVAHKEIVDRFGRFPHRNEILGRESTEEERRHVEEHGGF